MDMFPCKHVEGGYLTRLDILAFVLVLSLLTLKAVLAH